MTFALSMTASSGLKSALDASVLTATAGALLLAAPDRYTLGFDHRIQKRTNVG